MAHRRNLEIALGGALVGSGAQAVVPLVERQIVDNVILHHRSPLAPWLALLVGLGVVTFAAAYLRRYRGGRVALDVQYDLRNAMYGAPPQSSISPSTTRCRPVSSSAGRTRTRPSCRGS